MKILFENKRKQNIEWEKLLIKKNKEKSRLKQKVVFWSKIYTKKFSVWSDVDVFFLSFACYLIEKWNKIKSRQIEQKAKEIKQWNSETKKQKRFELKINKFKSHQLCVCIFVYYFIFAVCLIWFSRWFGLLFSCHFTYSIYYILYLCIIYTYYKYTCCVLLRKAKKKKLRNIKQVITSNHQNSYIFFFN